MFGSVLMCLQKHIEERLGKSLWTEVLVKAGQPPTKIYRAVYFYSDTEFEALLSACCSALKTSRDDLLRDLGKAFGRHLLSIYSVMFLKRWRSLDVIENAAPKVFKSIQFIDPYTPTSSVRCERISPDEVVIHYTSPRDMCSYIVGITEAMGEHFNEQLKVTHSACKKKGAAECVIHAKLIGSITTQHSST